MPLPLKIFQISDVCLLDASTETGARNERRLCAAYCNLSTSGFEVIHGLLDRVMLMAAVPLNIYKSDRMKGYWIRPSAIPMYFEGRQAEVVLDGRVIGSFGIVHPTVLEKFDVPAVCSLLEISIEPFLENHLPLIE